VPINAYEKANTRTQLHEFLGNRSKQLLSRDNLAYNGKGTDKLGFPTSEFKLLNGRFNRPLQSTLHISYINHLADVEITLDPIKVNVKLNLSLCFFFKLSTTI
jgi:hypothetical protein